VDGCEILHQLIGGKQPIIYGVSAFWWCRISSHNMVILICMVYLIHQLFMNSLEYRWKVINSWSLGVQKKW
jgi:hypothetical protein